MTTDRVSMPGPLRRVAFATSLAALANLAAAAFCPEAGAEEAVFGFTLTTDLLPKKTWEIEQTDQWRFTKNYGSYDELQNETDFEYGLTDRLQVALTTEYDWTRAFQNGPYGQTVPPEQFADANPAPNAHYDKFRLNALGVESTYTVLSPYTDPVGLAFFLELLRGPSFKEVEAKIILHKNYLDDRLTLAFNYTYAPEYRRFLNGDGNLAWQEETDVNYNFGVAYRFVANWSGGAEFLNEHEYNSYNFTHESNNGYFVGPVIHFGGKKFFVTADFVKQLPWAKPHPDTVPGALIGGYVGDNDFEKYRVRIKAAYYFNE